MNCKSIFCIRKIKCIYQIKKKQFTAIKIVVGLIDIIIIHKHAVNENIIVAPRMQINFWCPIKM